MAGAAVCEPRRLLADLHRLLGLLPGLIGDWRMSAADAGLIQSGWHVGYLVSLFGAGLLTDRVGARRTFLLMSGAAPLLRERRPRAVVSS